MSRFARILLASSVLVALALPAGAAAAPAGSTFLVSRPAGTPVAPTDNSSLAPLAITDDGRYVAFLSAADGFAPGANPNVINLFVRDTVTNTTVLASRSDGPNGAGVDADVDWGSHDQIDIAVEPGSLARDAPFDKPHVLVVFSTMAGNLVDHVDQDDIASGTVEEVWLRDITAGTTYLVSRARPDRSKDKAQAPANRRSRQPSIAISPIGPLVAFASEATNLSEHNSIARSKIYLRTINTGWTQTVSCDNWNCFDDMTPVGDSWEPDIVFIKGGQFPVNELCDPEAYCAEVAFTTANPDIAAGASWTSTQVVTARAKAGLFGTELAEFDRVRTGSLSSLVLDEPGNGSSWDPSLTPNGLDVAFLSTATNLMNPWGVLPERAAGYFHEYTTASREVTLAATVGFNQSGLTTAPNDSVKHLDIGGSSIWPRVVFDTAASNMKIPPSQVPIVRSYANGSAAAGTPLIPQPPLDRSSAGVLGDDVSSGTMISADSKYAVFESRSTNLDAGGGRDFSRIYKRNVEPDSPGFESMELVSRPSGTGAFSPGNKTSAIGPDSVSADGRFVAFESKADDLSSADDDRLTNLFVRDTVSGTTTLVSRANGANGVAADANSELNGISEDGQRVLFTTVATNFGTPGLPGPHAYVRDLAAGTTTVVTRGTGSSSVIVPGKGMGISGNGNRIAFATWLAVDPEAAGVGSEHLFVRDLSAQTTTFVDRRDGAFGAPADHGPQEASLDKTGNRVAWTTSAVLGAGDGPTTISKIYVRDLAAHTTVLASRAEGMNGASGDGSSRGPAIDAAGDTVAFWSAAGNFGSENGNIPSIWVRQLTTGHTELVSRASGAAGPQNERQSFTPVSIDAAGERIAFVSSASNLVPDGIHQEDPNTQVYVRDIKAKTTEAASRVSGSNGALADPTGFGAASISGNGDCVAFSTTGSNFTDPLVSADFRMVRERVLRGSCGPASTVAAEEPPPSPQAAAAVSNLRMQPGRFYVGADGGTQMSFVLSEASRVNVKFLRPAKHGADRVVGKLSVQGHAGTNRVEFSGRVKGRALAPGRYLWTATTQHGRASSGRFQVVVAPSRRAQRRHR